MQFYSKLYFILAIILIVLIIPAGIFCSPEVMIQAALGALTFVGFAALLDR